MESSVSSSTSTSTIHRNVVDQPTDQNTVSTAASIANSSPSSALPSPPDSPSSGSVSSFPSVSSSFFFSSAAASPPHPQSRSDHLRELTEGLIIPSLTLPSALRRPTAYGRAIGDLRLLVFGSEGTGGSFLTGLLLEDNEAVVDVGNWEEVEFGKVLYASTDWIEHKDAHGLEKYEPSRNIEIIDLPGYTNTSDGAELVSNIQSIIHAPFQALSETLHPDKPPSSLVANLISSSSTPLFTAMIFLLPSAPTALDQFLITELGNQIPLIVLPRLHSHRSHDATFDPNDALSSFRPSTPIALRSGLFHSPETLSLLRYEATDRFFKWREVERTVTHIHKPHHRRARSTSRHSSTNNGSSSRQKWDKAKWESEYLASLSHDVAKRTRGATITRRQASRLQLKVDSMDTIDIEEDLLQSSDSCTPLVDPLHLPSLFLFSISLLNPLRLKVHQSIADFLESLDSERNVRVALFGGICVGLGIGIMVKS